MPRQESRPGRLRAKGSMEYVAYLVRLQWPSLILVLVDLGNCRRNCTPDVHVRFLRAAKGSHGHAALQATKVGASWTEIWSQGKGRTSRSRGYG